ncbi:MAG: ribosomal-protein-alanine N-acetyltransferase [Idiomarinaceae bacterium HL-53]|nr:MAG: ribosomal-protein-alanine N-acetyltransferase [Idiomarinaceae bacterium HL-53]CUS48466.1 Ribosomal protein S18 acetylase RimI [Idiomarinaceae bacterium HL-53]
MAAKQILKESYILSQLVIQRAQFEDLEALAEIEAQCYGKNAYPFLFFAQAQMQWPNSLWVSRGEREVVTGYILMSPGAETDSWWLMSILITPTVRGQGVGQALLSHALNELNGAKTIYLTVAPANLSAIQLYEKFGFESIRTLENALGPGETRLLMKRTSP